MRTPHVGISCYKFGIIYDSVGPLPRASLLRCEQQRYARGDLDVGRWQIQGCLALRRACSGFNHSAEACASCHAPASFACACMTCRRPQTVYIISNLGSGDLPIMLRSQTRLTPAKVAHVLRAQARSGSTRWASPTTSCPTCSRSRSASATRSASSAGTTLSLSLSKCSLHRPLILSPPLLSGRKVTVTRTSYTLIPC